ncbi:MULTISPECIES: hypothetical protein [Streptomyces]|uniref:hypothetical protein n=1 Tax=Streptomyces TaxID=1883 RepID=UPI0006F77AD9|nr:hypothetical protein [Streptomyces sp. Root55]KQZ17707.1 hypothetical protein ASD51_31510 [Streptomyces sp. Root55]WRY79771.1 hypothetical protein OG388_00070 [Streptomyces clavifer]WRY86546.1 hypothetical protein OG388_37915 [Streptomyces clavifer]
MIIIGIVYLAAWLGFSLLGFLKLSDPKRQILYSGFLVTGALVLTFGLLRSAALGIFVFGIGAVAALVRLTRAWNRLPVNHPRADQ